MMQNDSQLQLLLFGNGGADGVDEAVELRDQEEHRADVERDKANNKAQPQNEESAQSKEVTSTTRRGRPPGKSDASKAAVPKVVNATTEVELGEGWTIFYAAKSTPIDELFDSADVASKKKVTLEDIRIQYSTATRSVEMSPTGTKWDMLESEKRIIPRVLGASKG